MSEEIKIEKGIPVSGPMKRGGLWVSIFRKMEVMDSFTVSDFKTATSACCSARQIGIKPCWRKQPDGTYRIWRKS